MGFQETLSRPQGTHIGAVMPESPLDTEHWWRHRNLRNLNLLMLIPLLSIFSQGWVFSQEIFV